MCWRWSCAALLVGSGCARFDGAQSGPFTTEPEMRAGAELVPSAHRRCRRAVPQGCPAPGVMQELPGEHQRADHGRDSQSALVAERVTGAVKEVVVNEGEPKVKLVIPVDRAGDGGLLDIVLSPTYTQDRLMYAYVSTPTDNQVIRIADGDSPSRSSPGSRRAWRATAGHWSSRATTLVVLTGDAGDPAAGSDPASAGGQGAAHRAADHRQPGAADHRAERDGQAPAGCATDPSDGSLYVTDRTPTGDRLQRITKDSKISTVWSWSDRPGVAGCAAPGRHRAGQPCQHQADRRGPAGPRHRSGDGRSRGGPSGPARTRVGAAAVTRRQRVGRNHQQDRR